MQVNLARALAARGYSVDLVLARAEGPFLREVPASVRVIDLKARHGLTCLPSSLRAPQVFRALAPILFASWPPRVLGCLPALVRYLQREQPSAFLAAQHYGNITALCAKRLAGVETRLVISQRVHLASYMKKGMKRKRRLVMWPVRRCYPWADGIVAVSDGVADDLSLTADIARERITTIYNPVIVPELREKASVVPDHPWFLPGSPPVLLGVGRLRPQKDFPTLLKAFARVRASRPARLLILGEGPDRAALGKVARDLGVADEVSLPGFVENPFAYMARAAVFALSSAYEGLPAVLIQAMACGCPVVSTDCPSGPAEILEQGHLGPLVPVGDDRALAGAILSVLDAPPDRDRLRARAASFSMDQAAARYLQLLLGPR
jgi:glycosyltransferase involved in cell wall biosynthesis